MIFHNNPGVCPVRRGSWIVVHLKGTAGAPDLHCRVADVTYFPTITIDEPVIVMQTPGGATITDTNTSLAPKDKPITPASTPKWAPASFQIYDQDFDALDRWGKNMSICKLLDTLPTVKAMQEWLQKSPHGDLKYWNARISPAALCLLRWIIASNRACIMQVDGSGSGAQDCLSGMKGYMQFRFAMGAPDKERRFMAEVVNTAQRLNLTYPTIFAWHGSPLYNWHMIIREGLHFKNADHGRAYGDGVYHAKDAQTACGYSGMGHGYNNGGVPGVRLRQWPQSILRINNALALNELVNAPAEYASSNPYYVVPQIDWIQTRYLFVQSAPLEDSGITIGKDNEPTLAFKQDPSRTPAGISKTAIVIPASAIKSRTMTAATKRRPDGSQSPLKKLKGMGGKAEPVLIDDDDDDDETSSQTTDAEDLEILVPEADPEPDLPGPPTESPSDAHRLRGSPTDFRPGTLDFATLPIMPEPEYANPPATKRLMKELQSLARTQGTLPLRDLGWYIDIEKIENVYQWIVELHSFHTLSPYLPLAADMRKAKLPSIVLELRFNRDFPFSPPYVRVIRPHFRSFAHGGGGHVVLGGAMCMELLTNSGWSSASSLESVLMQIRLAMASEPFARIEMGVRGDYGVREAAEGYLRACASHGWRVPQGFKEVRKAGGGGHVDALRSGACSPCGKVRGAMWQAQTEHVPPSQVRKETHADSQILDGLWDGAADDEELGRGTRQVCGLRWAEGEVWSEAGGGRGEVVAASKKCCSVHGDGAVLNCAELSIRARRSPHENGHCNSKHDQHETNDGKWSLAPAPPGRAGVQARASKRRRRIASRLAHC